MKQAPAIWSFQKKKDYCRKGPFLADIKSVDVIWEENPSHGGEKFEGFEIVM